MATSIFNAAHFQNEASAFAYVEARLWPNGPVCPRCGETGRIGCLNGKTTRVCNVAGANLYADVRSVIETARRRAIGALQAIRLTLNGTPLPLPGPQSSG